MQTVQQFCLRWNNHQPNFISVFTTLLSEETLVDVTLACEGKQLQAHRVVLSACSAYFQSLFTMNPCQHPIVILKDIKFRDLRTMVEFMYYGEVNVSQEQLPAILKIAEMLKIKGLADMQQGGSLQRGNSGGSPPASPAASPAALRRKRLRKSSTGSGSGSTEQTSEEQIGSAPRAPSRLSLRNSTQERSTDSEPREGSQDSGNEDAASSVTRHISIESRNQSFEIRQLSHDSRQSSIQDGRQLSHDRGERQASHESRLSLSLSHESSLESEEGKPEMPSSPSHAPSSSYQKCMGTKRGRLLMRQDRIKREAVDIQEIHTSPDSEPGSPGFPRSPPGTMLPFKYKPVSEPTLPTNSSNLLTVPRTTTHLQPLQPLKSSQSVDEPSPVPPIDNLPIVRVIADAEIKSEPIPILHTTQLTPVPVTPPTVPLSVVPMPAFPPPNLQQHLTTGPPQPVQELSSGSHVTSGRSGHCPVLRVGPALGCNFCWNTIDTRGRILRRKTKYHCPECQTNLCIVPCFQEYHHRLVEAPPQQASSAATAHVPSTS